MCPTWIFCPPTMMAPRAETRRVPVNASGRRGSWAVPARAPRSHLTPTADTNECGRGRAWMDALIVPSQAMDDAEQLVWALQASGHGRTGARRAFAKDQNRSAMPLNTAFNVSRTGLVAKCVW